MKVFRSPFPPLCHGSNEMVDDLKEADEAKAHAEAEKAARVCHKGYHCDFLFRKERTFYIFALGYLL